jgi:hypothetical protein
MKGVEIARYGLLRTRGKHDLGSGMACFCGVLLSAALAMAAGALAAGHSWANYTPLFFTLVPLFVALRFGSRAGVLGTVLSAVVLCLDFPKTLENLTARANLAWMLLLGLSFSFFFAPQSERRTREGGP